MLNVLFLCTGNSCRSQMAEGWAKKLKGNKYHFYSAGTKKHGLNPYAVKVMDECGVNIQKHYSKTVNELSIQKFDIVFTVCSDAHETCPVFPGSKVCHVGFEDPPRLSKDLNDDEEILNIYRKVRDEIKAFIESLDSYV